MNKKNFLGGVAIIAAIGLAWLPTEASGKKPKGKPATTLAQKTDTVTDGRQSAFKRLTAGAKSTKGLFTLYQTRSGNYYFEIADSLLGREMLMGSRVCNISNNSRISAGQRRSNPLLISFSRREKLLCLHQPSTDLESNPNDPIAAAVARNNLLPVTLTFDIAARNELNNASLIDVTKFFQAEVDLVWPAGVTNGAGRPDAKLTQIIEMKSFAGNVEVKTHYNYTGGKEPFALTVQYSFVLLPKVPMPVRYNDDRIGYSGSTRRIYTSGDAVMARKLIDRWDIRPRPIDREKYRNGETVEPQQPIVFYVDTVMPAEWRRYVREGIESWNAAFEKIGFKQVIRAYDYPSTPSFDSDDSRYNCFKYLPSTDANAMGARWTDPRSGQIVQGEILWWHNVIDKLRSWLFVQTAAADAEVRSGEIPAETMGIAIRYAAAHEMGHVLGMQHNMRASFAYPTDSLRSPAFTQRYGTTASIMDYARNNYIAQPGDKEKGVYLYPPLLGPYDDFSIQYAYRLIPEAATPEAELPVLNGWFTERNNHPFYLFGSATVSPVLPDPASQSDALGNDLLLSARYGISNLRYIARHLVEWTVQKDASLTALQERYDDLFKLYSKLCNLTLSYLGGVHYYPGTYQHSARYVPIDRKQQRETLRFLFEELTTAAQWLQQPELLQLIGPNTEEIMKWQSATVDALLGNFILNRILANQPLYTTQPYTPEMYLKEMDDALWQYSRRETLTPYDKHLQTIYIDKLLLLVKTVQNVDPKGNVRSHNETLWGTAAYGQLQQIQKRLQSQVASASANNRSHYAFLLNLVKDVLK